MGERTEGKGGFISRANVRDIVIVLSCGVALFSPISASRITISLITLAAGCFLHILVKGVLIRNTTLTRHGVYRLTRHPYYTANYLIDISFCLLAGNSYLLFAYPFLFFWAYGPTFRKEEAYLASVYDTYHRYSYETPQVLPDSQSIRYWKELLNGFSLSRITAKELSRVLRFWTVACFLLLLHDLRSEGLKELSPVHLHDYDGVVFFAALVFLSIGQFLLGRRSIKGEPSPLAEG